LFHSVSAFCTAGFGLFADSFMSEYNNPGVNIVLAIMSIAGAIGFFVMKDVYSYLRLAIRKDNSRRLTVHSKLALTLSIMLMLFGSILILIFEKESNLPAGDRIMTSIFQSISASTTTGFNTVDIGALASTSLFIMIILMFIGASPGGTGGGIKTTTFGAIILFIYALLRGKEEAHIFGRQISRETIDKALAIGVIAVSLVTLDMAVLISTERATFLNILFEVISAIGTVGLSTGITSSLTTVGKLVIIITMLIGRVGILAVGFSLFGRPEPDHFRWAEEELYIG